MTILRKKNLLQVPLVLCLLFDSASAATTSADAAERTLQQDDETMVTTDNEIAPVQAPRRRHRELQQPSGACCAKTPNAPVPQSFFDNLIPPKTGFQSPLMPIAPAMYPFYFPPIPTAQDSSVGGSNSAPSPVQRESTPFPIIFPTQPPISPPTNAPVPPPTNAPVPPPTNAPVPPPTNAPVPPPTNAPVPLPTFSPVTPPTGAPVAPPIPRFVNMSDGIPSFRYNTIIDQPSKWLDTPNQVGSRLMFDNEPLLNANEPEAAIPGHVFGLCTQLTIRFEFYCTLEWNTGTRGSLITSGKLHLGAFQSEMALVGGTQQYAGVTGQIIHTAHSGGEVPHYIVEFITATGSG